ncbi:MAG TPA: hypothetical protein VHK06_07820 [Candidatus Limnocylindria bacterium]|nr:hypothetical protein [Candidatus Limnocylindria bacterium]
MPAELETWELWYPAAAATGLPFARGRIDPTDVLWVHAAPDRLAVVVRRGDGEPIARGEPLERQTDYFPMTRLARSASEITREDRWPAEADLGALVILPGGEVGTLVAWWNAPDGSEWRWRIELYNHR